MTIIALQSPWPAGVTRQDKPAQASNALPPVSTVQALPDSAAHGLRADHPSLRDRSRENFTFRESVDRREPHDRHTPQPFPELRFADPLPDLPELDLPAKAIAYQAALGVLRGDDPA